MKEYLLEGLAKLLSLLIMGVAAVVIIAIAFGGLYLLVPDVNSPINNRQEIFLYVAVLIWLVGFGYEINSTLTDGDSNGSVFVIVVVITYLLAGANYLIYSLNIG